MFLKGFRFGLLLQLAVGPVCLFVFGVGGQFGFASSCLAATAVTLVDALFILVAGIGLTAFLRHVQVQRAIRIAGGLVLILFGLDIALSSLSVNLLPAVRLFGDTEGSGIFLKAALMTASNPLTILFWGGVLTATVVSENIVPRQLVPFGLGCVCATFLFLNAVGLAGTAMGTFLPGAVLKAVNICVGVTIASFGLTMLGRKAK